MLLDRPDEQLMAAYVGTGDQAAFATLFKRYTPLLSHIARGYVREQADVRDIVQQTFLQLHRARLDYTPDRPLRPYITTICVNLCREHYRRRGRRPQGDALGEVPVAATQHLRQESLQAQARVRKALERLPDAQREVITLHWLAEMPFADIAAALDVGLSAVKVRAHRGYEALRGLLADETF